MASVMTGIESLDLISIGPTVSVVFLPLLPERKVIMSIYAVVVTTDGSSFVSSETIRSPGCSIVDIEALGVASEFADRKS